MKYFVLGSVASGLFLLGTSFVYGFSGTINFYDLLNFATHNGVAPAFVLGLILIVTAMFFKLSAAPFHSWAPDVYEGSNISTTTFFAVVAKFAGALALIRLFCELQIFSMSSVLILVALVSMAVSSFGAIKQKNIKRLLAYSGIGHVGFVLLGLASSSFDGVKASIIYMIIYSFITMGSFAFLNIIFNSNDESEDEIFDLKSMSGLANTHPIYALAFSTFIFSTAGIPPFAGFFAKLHILKASIDSGMIAISVIAILFSVISAFYYLRIIKTIYFDKPSALKLRSRFIEKTSLLFFVVFNIFVIVILQYIDALVSYIL
jgi:NADH-quinone oxidoreductase subunit N